MTTGGRRSGPRVLVAGDAILDRYIRTRGAGRGRASTVPSLSVESTEFSAGGAANTALNVAVLGGRVDLVATVGPDATGAELLRILGRHGVDTRMVRVGSAATAVKTRVLHGGTQVLRLDEGLGGSGPPFDRSAERTWTAVLPPDLEALLISDYDYGTLDDRTADRMVGRPDVVVVDARRLERWSPLRPTLATCDEVQARRICPGFDPAAGARTYDDLRPALLAATGAEAVALTLGRRGAVLLRGGTTPLMVPVPHDIDGDAVGSGDVFAATAALVLAQGRDVVEAVETATMTATGATAAAVRTGRTAVAADHSRPGHHAAPTRPTGPSGELGALAAWAADQHRRGARIVFAGGCFDLLHEGHVDLLTKARQFGDVLLVAVNDDDGVRALKGSDRPVVDLAGRLRVLRALSCVDHVTSFSGTSPVAAIEAVRPHVFVKGGDYSVATLPEADLLIDLGVQIRILDLVPDRSTTRLVARARILERPHP